MNPCYNESFIHPRDLQFLLMLVFFVLFPQILLIKFFKSPTCSLLVLFNITWLGSVKSLCLSANLLFKLLSFIFQATFDCLMKTYGFLTPDFWTETRFTLSPYQQYTDLLSKPVTKFIQPPTEEISQKTEV